MISQPVFPYRLASQGDSLTLGGPGSNVQLAGININTGVASGVITVYSSNPSVAGSKIATIDATTAAGTAPRPWPAYGANCKNGLSVYVTGGNVECTVFAS